MVKNELNVLNAFIEMRSPIRKEAYAATRLVGGQREETCEEGG